MFLDVDTAFPVISIKLSSALEPYYLSDFPLTESFFLKFGLDGGGRGGLLVELVGCYYFFIEELICFCLIAAFLS